MNLGSKRRLAAWALLSVFVPMLMLSAVHTHGNGSPAADGCKECVSHVPHGGHLASDTGSIHDCVLCQFLAIPYVAAAAVAVSLFLRAEHVSSQLRTAAVVSRTGDDRLSRAPPFFCSPLTLPVA